MKTAGYACANQPYASLLRIDARYRVLPVMPIPPVSRSAERD
jgi:hypothetical protein